MVHTSNLTALSTHNLINQRRETEESMNKAFNYLKQASTWEGVVTALVTVALATGDIATGGAVTGVLTVVGGLAAATSIARDDSKKGD